MQNNQTIFYTQQLNNLSAKEILLKKVLRWLAFGRLASFGLLFVSIFVLTPKYIVPGIIITVLFIALFLYLIKIHLQKNKLHLHTRALIDINNSELKALEHEYSCFPTGDEFNDHNHPYSYDMDLFGDGSLFQYINRTVTFKGKEKLASSLTIENLNSENIAERQKAVRELSPQIQMMQDFRAVGALTSENGDDLKLLKEWINRPVFYLERKIWKVLTVLLPVITLISIAGAFFFSGFINVFIFLYLIQFILIGFRLKHTSSEHALIGKRLDALKKYRELIVCIEKTTYQSAVLNKIYQQLFTNQTSAAMSVSRLSNIVKSFDSRLNMIAAMFLEGIFLWDIRCMIQLERWKTENGKFLELWIDAIAEFDSLVSLANFTFNHPEYTFPVCSRQSILEAEDLGHVLIPNTQRVTNNFSIGKTGQFIIITGANMAGKSTFLRTVATNLILAMTGAPVCAKSFSFRPMKLFSSMRTSDSLNKNESYFYAELKRLKEMLDKLKSGEEIFIILDEILKGTNSIDKQKGSKALLEQIINLHGTGIIATHDLELTKTQEAFPEQIKNMCFEIEIDQAAISFDYKIRIGVTTKMNATILMKQMGIGIE